jgi:hypothetical protein
MLPPAAPIGAAASGPTLPAVRAITLESFDESVSINCPSEVLI